MRTTISKQFSTTSSCDLLIRCFIILLCCQYRQIRKHTGIGSASLSGQALTIIAFLPLALGCGSGGGSGGETSKTAVIVSTALQYATVRSNEPGTTELSLALDAYIPEATSGLAPGIIFIHGGGWISGVREDNAGLALAFAEKGFVTFTPSYRIATSKTPAYPNQLYDLQTAVRWIRANAQQFNLDPNRLGVAGISSGGQLSSLLVNLEGSDVSTDPKAILPLASSDITGISSRPNAAASISAPSDLTTLFPQALQSVIAAVFPKGTLELASPIFRINEHSTPILLLHGTNDEIVPFDQATRFHDALVARGRNVTLAPIQNGGHGLNNSAESTQVALELELFFRERLDLPNR